MFTHKQVGSDTDLCDLCRGRHPWSDKQRPTGYLFTMVSEEEKEERKDAAEAGEVSAESGEEEEADAG